jgi:hypothetical protein
MEESTPWLPASKPRGQQLTPDDLGAEPERKSTAYWSLPRLQTLLRLLFPQQQTLRSRVGDGKLDLLPPRLWTGVGNGRSVRD